MNQQEEGPQGRGLESDERREDRLRRRRERERERRASETAEQREVYPSLFVYVTVYGCVYEERGIELVVRRNLLRREKHREKGIELVELHNPWRREKH